MSEVTKRIELPCYDLDIVVKFSSEPSRDEVTDFVDFLVGANPTLEEAIKKSVHFFNCKVLGIEGYQGVELLSDFISIEVV